MNKPQLLAIQIAADKGAPMQSLETVQAIEGAGLDGDRYATGKGAFSKTRDVVRHLSLIESEAIQDVRESNQVDLTFADTRRNLLTVGIRLNDLVGKQFRIGEVLVEGVELCDPCARPGKLSGKPELNNFKELLDGRGGLRVKIISTGVLKTGDAIEIDE